MIDDSRWWPGTRNRMLLRSVRWAAVGYVTAAVVAYGFLSWLCLVMDREELEREAEADTGVSGAGPKTQA